MAQRWTKEMDAYIQDNYKSKSAKELASELTSITKRSITAQAVYQRLIQIDKKPRPFIFGQGSGEHWKGDKECKGCRWSEPRPCSTPHCNGLVHTEYVGDIKGSHVIFELYCDKCQDYNSV